MTGNTLHTGCTHVRNSAPVMCRAGHRTRHTHIGNTGECLASLPGSPGGEPARALTHAFRGLLLRPRRCLSPQRSTRPSLNRLATSAGALVSHTQETATGTHYPPFKRDRAKELPRPCTYAHLSVS